MISLEELTEIKTKRKTTLFYEEKEYLQFVFLNAIAKYTDSLIFKGGTCLRICFGLERASEDLDFNTTLSKKELKNIIAKALKDFEFLNIPFEPYSQKEFEGNLRIEVRLKGPLFMGNPVSSNTLKLDFNKNQPKYTEVKVIQKLFSDVPFFTLIVMAEREMLPEKIRAMVRRREARDFYDVWVLLNTKVTLDKSLLAIKLKEEKCRLTDFLPISQKEYEVSLKNLLKFVPPYEQVMREIKEKLNL